MFLLTALCLLVQVEPITPGPLREALANPTDMLAERLRAAYPPGTDLAVPDHPPLIEGNLVAFVLEARPTNPPPRIVGDLDHGRGLPLTRVGSTRLWAAVAEVPADAVFGYEFRAGTRRLGRRIVTMPGATPVPEAARRPGVKYGQYDLLEWTDPSTGRPRTGWAYVPDAALDTTKPLALLVFLDGDAYRHQEVGTIVDNLIRDGKLPRAVVIGVNPGRDDDGNPARVDEFLRPGPDLIDAIEGQLFTILPDYPYREDPAGRAIIGTGSGGLAAFNAARERPEVFGRVLAQLGRFTIHRDGKPLPDLVRAAPKQPLRFVLTTTSNDRIDPSGDWHRATLDLADALKDRADSVDLIDGDGFPNMTTVGRQLPEALRRLWADEIGGK